MIIWGILIYGTAVEENQTTSFSTGLDVGLKSSTTLNLKVAQVVMFLVSLRK